MPYLEAITNLINEDLKQNTLCDERFANGLFGLIAVDGVENDGAATKSFPVIYNLAGQGIKANPDDTYAIQIYHKIYSRTYSVKPSSVGNRNNKVVETTEAKLVVMGWTNRLQLSQEDLSSLLASNFPDQIKPALYQPLKLDNLSILLRSCNLDKRQVFGEEYKGLAYAVKPEQILFEMRYQIESTYKKGCFIITDCQAQYYDLNNN